MASANHVDLGFVEKSESWRLLSHFFPHKVGGKPSWLCLQPLPTVDNLQCGKCGKPCCFLAQLYCPVPGNPGGTCFHRTLFVFICKDPLCCQGGDSTNLVVLRSQLPRKNKFYSSDAPNEETFQPNSTYTRAEDYHTLCVVCGVAGSKRCAKCHKANYCSKDHQIIDWKAGHKIACKQTGMHQDSETTIY